MRRTAPRAWQWILVLATIVPALGLTAARAAVRPWLGVYTQEITGELRDGLDVNGEGVLVNRVVEGGPADRAGLRNGDVILRFNSRTLHSPGELSELVGDAREGQEVALSIVRDGDTRTLAVTLGERPSGDGNAAPEAPEPPAPPAAPHVMRFHTMTPDAPAIPGEKRREMRVRVETPDDDAAPGDGREKRKIRVRVDSPGHPGEMRDYVIDGDHTDLDVLPEHARRALEQLDGLGNMGQMGQLGRLGALAAAGDHLRLGVRLEPLNDDLAAALGSPGAHGVLVLEPMKDTAAERAGIKAGDIIVSVDGHEVGDAEALRIAVRDADGSTPIVVLRHGSRQTVQADLGSAPRSARGEGSDHGRSEGDERVDRLRARDRADSGDLRQQIDELRQQLRELRQQLEERHH